MAERYFSVADVEALIPKLSRLMGRVMSAHAEAGEAQQRMQAEQQRISLAGGGVLDRRAWRADTCLLYTSPSPRDRQKSRMPSSA